LGSWPPGSGSCWSAVRRRRLPEIRPAL
jgi:hypothetical protein